MVISQPEQYFDLSEKSELSASKKMKLQIYGQTMGAVKYKTAPTLNRCGRCAKIFRNARRLNAELEKCHEKHNTYSDTAKTYCEISSGDYISRLVTEEEKRRENEQRKKSVKLIDFFCHSEFTCPLKAFLCHNYGDNFVNDCCRCDCSCNYRRTFRR